MSDVTKLTLTELAAAIRRRRLSSVELTEALLERIEQWQPVLNAFVRVNAEGALKAAAAADRALARGKSVGPLHGIPLAHKDMYYRAGELSECGSKLRKGFRPTVTSTAIARLDAAGAIRLGELNMAEFAYNPTGHNEHFGDARNAFNPTHVTGGSSSGSGTGVAARITPAALGSDTGGSIRMPAHFCGITGLKPTYGRVSRANAMPLSFTLDTVGPLALSAEDAGLIMSVMSGPDPLDPATAQTPAWNARAAKRSVKGMTVGVPTAYYVDGIDADTAKTLDRTIRTLRKLGAKIVKVKLPDQTAVSAASTVIIATESVALHITHLRERPDEFGFAIRRRLENGLAFSAAQYLEVLRWRGPALAAHLAAIGDVDVVLAPTAATPAPRIDETDIVADPGVEAKVGTITQFTRPINFLGLPVLVAPCGKSADGLPIGLQFIGRPYGDETLIALGRAFQAETGFHKRIPELP